jgi:hypothetical protein
MHVLRSFQSTKRESVSAPTTSAFLMDPLRMACAAMLSAKMKPVHAASRSKAPAFVAPNWSWIRQAVAGKIYSGLEVEQMIRSRSVGRRLATSSALSDASTPRLEA